MKKILIANRGEIASRVIKTCKTLGIETVAIYAQDDRDLLFVKQADYSIALGYGKLSDTYLNQELIIKMAKEYNCDAIYPGYGFLSENAIFAKKVVDAGITFIGPTPEAIKLMGDKKDSKKRMEEIGAPLVPGYHGENQESSFLKNEAIKIGFPLLIKASAGGGGKGMRIVNAIEEFESALSSAKREALNAFGDDKVLLEKYILSPRHIEVQLVSDGSGNAFHFYERECSIQRRYQKIIEETPAVGLGQELRENICQTAVTIANSIKYVGAGTVEFIMDENGKFYFLEMNTRLQVEHPITEMVTGVDLVELQIVAAKGEKFNFSQHEISQIGHAIECRIYAEDPDNEFLPTSGRIQKVSLGVYSDYRFDHSLIDGHNISLSYDPMLAKVIVHGDNRDIAIHKMKLALNDTIFGGVTTNRNYLKRILKNKKFNDGVYSTNFVIEEVENLKREELSKKQKMEFLGSTLWTEYKRHFNDVEFVKKAYLNGDEFEIVVKKVSPLSVSFSFEDKIYSMSFELIGERFFLVHDEKKLECSWFKMNKKGDIQIELGDLSSIVYLVPKVERKHDGNIETAGSLLSPMPGKIFKILITEGAKVKKGEPILILEAMKMEHVIKSNSDGILKSICFKEGEQVMGGVQLVEIEA